MSIAKPNTGPRDVPGLLARARAIAFDVDGTLYDVGRQRLRLWRSFLRHPRVLGAYPAAFSSLRGSRFDDAEAEVARRVAAEIGAPPEQVRAILDDFLGQRWPATFGPGTPFPGIRPLIEAIDARGIPRAIVSDYPSAEKLRRMGLDAGWAAVIDCRALGALKPLPDGLLAAAEALGTPPEQIVLLGDRPDTDGEMALAAGAVALIRGRDYSDEAALLEHLSASGERPR